MTRTERWEGERWPEVERDEDYDRGPRRESKPIVNPYAVVALVAALVGLFPVAIVFGLIAFGHPRGKGMATFALLIGLAEVAAIAGFVVLSGSALSDAVKGTTKQAVAPQVTTPQQAQASTAPPKTTVPEATTTSSPAKVQGTPTKGTACTEAQVGLIASGSDSSTLICLFTAGVNGGYKWAGPYTVGSGVQQTGTTCDPSGVKSARTTEGRALVCEGQGRNAMWVPWTE
ncbi:hypothetical protein [Nocardia sp. NPDC052566]|uniref:hypothetical protein n=1 Tax=Nocardia sp. NPDC052566 TaxID=3364330 RepID=UPI0037C64B64